jgi:hypothetical protein
MTNLDFITAVVNSRLIVLWDFLQTPAGNLVLASAGAVWLLGLVFWPSRSRNATDDDQLPAIDSKPGDEPCSRESIVPPAKPVISDPNLKITQAADVAQPPDELWVAAEGHVLRLTRDETGCTAVLKSGKDTIHARFDETWFWYLNHLKQGITLKIEGRTSTEKTDQLHLLDCVCPDGIRIRPFPPS